MENITIEVEPYLFIKHEPEDASDLDIEEHPVKPEDEQMVQDTLGNCQVPMEMTTTAAARMNKIPIKRTTKAVRNVASHGCPFCCKIYKTAGGCRRHVARIHNKTSYKCGNCNHTFTLLTQLQLHLNTCQAQETIECEMKQEIDEDNTLELMEFRCKFCLRTFSILSKLQEHESSCQIRECSQETFMESSQGMFTECSQGTFMDCSQEPIVKRPQEPMVERLQGPFAERSKEMLLESYLPKCSICNVVFPSTIILNLHFTKDHTEQSKFPCNLCSSVFSSELHLKNHKDRLHYPKVKSNIQCIKCSAVFTSLLNLNIHEINEHAEKYSCNICGKCFIRENALKSHSKIHEMIDGERSNEDKNQEEVNHPVVQLPSKIDKISGNLVGKSSQLPLKHNEIVGNSTEMSIKVNTDILNKKISKKLVLKSSAKVTKIDSLANTSKLDSGADTIKSNDSSKKIVSSNKIAKKLNEDPSKITRTPISLEQKLMYLREYDKKGKDSIHVLAKRLKIPVTTLSSIVTNRKKIEEIVKSGKPLNSAKMRGAKFEDIEKDVYQFYLQSVEKGEVISGPILQAKAEELAVKSNINDFKVSLGWLENFKKRYNIIFTRSLTKRGKNAESNKVLSENVTGPNSSLMEQANSTNSNEDSNVNKAELNYSKSHSISRTPIKLEKKLEYLQAYDKRGKTSLTALAKKLNVKLTTLVTIVANRNNLEALKMSERPLNASKIHTGKHKYLEELLYKFYVNCGKTGHSINGPMLQAKAEKLAKKLNIVDFKASPGWLVNFKKRHNISTFKKNTAEVASMDVEDNNSLLKSDDSSNSSDDNENDDGQNTDLANADELNDSSDSETSEKNAMILTTNEVRAKRVRKPITLETKLRLLQEYDNRGTMTVTDLAKKLKISLSTLLSIVANRKKLKELEKSGKPLNTSVIRNAKYEDLEKKLYDCLLKAAKRGRPITEPFILCKAEKLAKKLNIVDFGASHGWLWNFKKRHNINSFKDFKVNMEDNNSLLSSDDSSNSSDSNENENDQNTISVNADELNESSDSEKSEKNATILNTNEVRAKRVRKPITLGKKLRLLQEYDNRGTMTVTDLAKKLKISISTLLGIVANRKKLKELETSGKPLNTSVNRNAKYEDLETILYDFLLEAAKRGKSITRQFVLRKAEELAEKLNIVNFRVSFGWLWKFKKRHNIKAFKDFGVETNSQMKNKDTSSLSSEDNSDLSDEENEVQKVGMPSGSYNTRKNNSSDFTSISLELDDLESSKNTRVPITLEKKLQYLHEYDNRGRMSVGDLAKKLQISTSTLSTIVRKRKQTELLAKSGTSLISKTSRGAKFENVEKLVYEFFVQSVQDGSPISGKILRQKAEEVAKQMNITDFRASSGWLEKFKKRHSIKSFRNLTGGN